MNLSNCRRDMTIVTTNQTGDMTGYWNEICNNKVFFVPHSAAGMRY